MVFDVTSISLPDVGLLILRLVVGVLISLHGYEKIKSGAVQLTGLLESLKWPVPKFFAGAVSWGEFFAGIGIATGTFAAVPELGVITIMVGAIRIAHWKRTPYSFEGGWEYPAHIIAGALALSLLGDGQYSLQQFIDLAISSAGGL